MPEVKVIDASEHKEDEEDPDAVDEVDCSYSWCPQPTGCCLTRAEWACYLIPPSIRIRIACNWLVKQKSFDYGVLFFIALNCITLAMERPDIPPNSVERQFLTIANYCFTVIFSTEMIIKVVAKGFVIGKHAYLKSGWNVMDGFLVIISLVDIFISLVASSSPRIFGILRVFRLLRTLRPLRVISRAPGLKLVVQTLLSSLRPIGNIVLICCTFFIIFGILGVQLFKGTFYHCITVSPELSGLTGNLDHIRNKTDCMNMGRGYRWVNQKYNFDNLGQALMSLFVLASKDGWVNIMYTGLDAVGVDQQPRENYSEWRLLYFISFLLLVGFFVLNMFVGVVVENFHKCRESQEKEEKARRAAKRAKKLEKKRKKMKEPPYWANYSKSRLFIHTVTSSKYFDLAIAGVIGLNVITMALEFYMMPEELQFALKIFNYFFTSVFILEAVVKIIALSFVRYIRDRWNQLDIAIVILSIIGIFLEEMKSGVIPINPTIIRVMRVLRIARVLKLLKMAKGIRALLDTVVQALPQVGNLGLLFFLLFFIFAALGVELFGRLECSELHPCEGLGVHAHFQHFGMAFLTLFRVATGDNWNGIMKDTLREDCDPSDDCLRNCCVSAIIAPVFFVVFVLMAQFVLVNVVVAVLMKHLEESHKQMDDDIELDAEIQRELDEEQRNNADQREKADERAEEKMAEGAEDNIEDDVDEEEEEEDSSSESEEMKHKPVHKQMSLPPNFTFSVRPPSVDSSGRDDSNPSDGRVSPGAIELTLPSEDCMTMEQGEERHYSPQLRDPNRPMPRLRYLPKQRAIHGSASSLPSSSTSHSASQSTHSSNPYLTPTEQLPPLGAATMHGSVPNVHYESQTSLPRDTQPLLCSRHQSQPALSIFNDSSDSSDDNRYMLANPDANVNTLPWYSGDRHGQDEEEAGGDQSHIPLQAMDSSGDSNQDFLNANTVFGPRSDGVPPGHHRGDVIPDPHSMASEDDEVLVDNWDDEECDEEIEKITGIGGRRDGPCSPLPTLPATSPDPRIGPSLDIPHVNVPLAKHQRDRTGRKPSKKDSLALPKKSDNVPANRRGSLPLPLYKENRLSPRPFEGRATPRPSEGRVTPRPPEGRVTPRPPEGRVTPRPSEGRVTPRPSEGHVAPRSIEGRNTPRPPLEERVTPQHSGGERAEFWAPDTQTLPKKDISKRDCPHSKRQSSHAKVVDETRGLDPRTSPFPRPRSDEDQSNVEYGGDDCV